MNSNQSNDNTPFRPIKFDSVKFQPLTLSSLALSTACYFNRRKLDLHNLVQGYSNISRRSETIEMSKNPMERHQSDGLS